MKSRLSLLLFPVFLFLSFGLASFARAAGDDAMKFNFDLSGRTPYILENVTPFMGLAVQSDLDLQNLEVRFGSEKTWKSVIFGNDGYGFESLQFTSAMRRAEFRFSDAPKSPAQLRVTLFPVENLDDLAFGGRALEASLTAATSYPFISRKEWGADESIRILMPDESEDSGSTSSSTEEEKDPCN